MLVFRGARAVCGGKANTAISVASSGAHGTLVVHFDEGRVSRVSLVTRAVETAMLAPKATPEGVMVESRK